MARKVFIGALLCVCFSYLAEAQSFYNIQRPRNLLVNLGSGIAYYKGDLVNPGQMGFIKPNVTLGAEYFFNERISGRAQLTWFQIKGDDRKANDDRNERNLHFQSGNIEFAATGAVSLFPQVGRYYQRPKFNVHGFTGIGLLYFNPKAELDGKMYALRKYMTENVAYSRLTPVIPVGLGARVFINPYFNILIEGGYRFTFTDYLDDVSKKRYVHIDELGGDPTSIRARLADRRPEIDTQPFPPHEKGVRGNPENNDGYFIMNISVQYYLPKEIFNQSQRKLYTHKRRSIFRKR